MRKAFIGIILVLVVGCGGSVQPTATAPAPTGAAVQHPASNKPIYTVKQAKVLVADDGIQVALLEIGDQQALIRVTGVNTEIEGKVLKYEREERSYGYHYMTQVYGRPRGTLGMEQRYGHTTWRLYAPGRTRDGIVVAFDEAKTKALDIASILKLHEEQTARGELAELQRFHRDVEEKNNQLALESARDRMAKFCGTKPAVEIQWSLINDAALLKYNIAGYCDSVLSAMRQLCRYQAGKNFFQPIQKVTCQWGKKETQLQQTAGQLIFSVAAGTPNLDQWALRELRQARDASGKSLMQLIQVEDTDVCFTNQKKIVILAPDDAEHSGLAYGDGKNFFHVGQPRGLSRGWFFDPRQFNKNHNSGFRGYDLRYYSHVDVDRAKKTCRLTCGERTADLKMATELERAAVLSAATYQPSPHQRTPYALARNERGKYYFIDRGITEATAKDFRVYVGPRGRLKLQRMKDIVSDSEGEIFSTQSGALRLLLGKDQAWWIANKKKNKLLLLPIKENFTLIYNELGVYLGKQLGVPCDDI